MIWLTENNDMARNMNPAKGPAALAAAGLALGATLLASAGASAQVPEGFEIVEFAEGDYFAGPPRMNNCGQIVYYQQVGPDWYDKEVFVYDNGRIMQISRTDHADRSPDINDRGEVVWNRRPRGTHGKDIEIMRYRNGLIDVVQRYDDGVREPGINDLGHIVWPRSSEGDCEAPFVIMRLDETGRKRMTPKDDITDQWPQINNRGWIAWDHTDHCQNPRRGYIQLYRSSEIITLPSAQDWSQLTTINDVGQVAWSADFVELWENGRTQVVADPGRNPRLNNLGDCLFIRWHEDRRVWQTWLRRVSEGHEEYLRLVDEPRWNTSGDINDWGEACWNFLTTPDPRNLASGQRIMRRTRTGDADFDWDVDLADLSQFSACMTDPDWDEANQRGPEDCLCDCRFLDIDHDGDVDLNDFARFQNAFTGQR
ncbi:MAG: hypothetical protein C4547_13400 [Phycisphaerales bacterium]|nr:MAG: hypothetical protein C4547_13400 [Phycisphaerales bacterium]